MRPLPRRASRMAADTSHAPHASPAPRRRVRRAAGLSGEPAEHTARRGRGSGHPLRQPAAAAARRADKTGAALARGVFSSPKLRVQRSKNSPLLGMGMHLARRGLRRGAALRSPRLLVPLRERLRPAAQQPTVVGRLFRPRIGRVVGTEFGNYQRRVTMSLVGPGDPKRAAQAWHRRRPTQGVCWHHAQSEICGGALYDEKDSRCSAKVGVPEVPRVPRLPIDPVPAPETRSSLLSLQIAENTFSRHP